MTETIRPQDVTVENWPTVPFLADLDRAHLEAALAASRQCVGTDADAGDPEMMTEAALILELTRNLEIWVAAQAAVRRYMKSGSAT